MTLNEDRCAFVINRLVEMAPHIKVGTFNLDKWSTSCGTVRCALGWVLSSADAEEKLDLFLDGQDKLPTKTLHVKSTGKPITNLTLFKLFGSVSFSDCFFSQHYHTPEPPLDNVITALKNAYLTKGGNPTLLGQPTVSVATTNADVTALLDRVFTKGILVG